MNRYQRLIWTLGFVVSVSAFATVQEPQATGVIATIPQISEVVIRGNKLVSDEAIRARAGLRVGSSFSSEDVSAAVERLVNFGYFSRVRIEKESAGADRLRLVIRVAEKQGFSGYLFEGNSVIATKKLAQELGLIDREVIDAFDLDLMVAKLRKAYRKENYYAVDVKATLVPDREKAGQVRAVFLIKEGDKTRVTRVDFQGCSGIPEFQLRSMIHTKEDWLGFFTDGAGKYDKDYIEADKKLIEMIYQDHGYLTARVLEARIEELSAGREIHLTFVIHEGPQFKVRYITLPADAEFPEHTFLRYLLLKEGQTYSRESLRRTVDLFLRALGEKGYIEADVWPDLKIDEANGVVDLKFGLAKGEKYYVNRIDITGNKSTRDFVIRREIALEEGGVATKAGLDDAKHNVEYLGYFERGSVEWKKHRLPDGKVNLELNVKEASTGRASFMATYGGGSTTSRESLKFGGEVQKINLGGLGWDGGFGVQFGKDMLQSINLNFQNPFLFDTNVLFGVDTYFTRGEYEEWGHRVTKAPLESKGGITTRLGCLLTPFSSRVSLLGEFGAEKFSYDKITFEKDATEAFKNMVEDKFSSGNSVWLGGILSGDHLNHRLAPSGGYKWELHGKMSPPAVNSKYSFIKFDAAASWHMALMGDDWMVLSIYGKCGIVMPLEDTKPIPHKELYLLGGTHMLRGFRMGEAGPLWNVNNQAETNSDLNAENWAPLGARRMLLGTAEISMPIGSGEQAPRAYAFFDVGAGWDAPIPYNLKASDFAKLVSDYAGREPEEMYRSLIYRNKFNLRKTVGVGLKMTTPYPFRIDWGYKLDRDRIAHERPAELNISMNVPF